MPEEKKTIEDKTSAAKIAENHKHRVFVAFRDPKNEGCDPIVV